MRFEGFVGASAQNRSLPVACDRTMNLIPEVVDSGTPKARLVFHGSPGLRAFMTLPDAPVRGLWSGDNRLFAAAGTHFYEVFSNGTYSELGTIADDAAHSPVQIYPNGTQLLVISARNAYIADGVTVQQPAYATYTDLAIDGSDNHKISSAGTPFAAGDIGAWIDITGGTGFTVQRVLITAVDGSGVATCDAELGTTGSTAGTGSMPVMGVTGAFLDGYFITHHPSTKRVNISALYNGLSWDPLDFAIKEGDPYNVATVLADHEELWVFGTQSIEVWVNTANADFPFEPLHGAHIEQGCLAPWSVAKLDNSILWLGGDPRGNGMVWRANGYVPVRISNHALERSMQGYSRIDDAEAYTYQEEGHQFYVLNFPTADSTWVFDASTGLWHERGGWNSETGVYHRHRSRCHAFMFGMHLVGDFETGAIHEMALDAYDDNGSPKRWLRIAPHISNEMKWLFYDSLMLDMEVGVGTEAVPNPTVGMKLSSDGGRTWSTERTAAIGAAGAFRTRVRWLRLGRARDRVFQVYGSAAVKTSIIDALLEFQPGNGS